MRRTITDAAAGIRWVLRLAAFLLVIAPLAACRVSEDAAAASQQMTNTASALRAYYAALADEVSDTIALYELDASLSGIPFDQVQRQLPEDTRVEIVKRQEMAEGLAHLAQAMTTLSHLNAAGDAETAATSLGNQLITMKALPGGSPIPEALSKAGRFLVDSVQQHKEQETARAMDETLAGLAELFEKEKPTYDSLSRTHLRQASAVAKDLIAQNAVDATPMLTPALRPFSLTPLPAGPQMQESLKKLASARLDRAVDTDAAREMDASRAMLEGLQEMSRRIHTLATDKVLRLRGDPLSLATVTAWTATQPAKGV